MWYTRYGPVLKVTTAMFDRGLIADGFVSNLAAELSRFRCQMSAGQTVGQVSWFAV